MPRRKSAVCHAGLLLATLLLCSCRNLATTPSGTLPADGVANMRTEVGVHPASFASPGYPVMQAAYQPAMLPPNAFTGAPYMPVPGAGIGAGGGCSCCSPNGFAGAAYDPQAAGCNGSDWKPTGIPCPWPADEYICDGGDRELGVEVMQDWTVLGLDSEDTVAHFDTVDGRLLVEASNRVCVYAPRFASVRKVYGIVAHENRNKLHGVDQPVQLVQSQDRDFAATATQPVQAQLNLGLKTPNTFREQTRGLGVDNSQPIAALQDRFRPYEDFQIIRQGRFDNSEKPRLNEHINAALAWTSNQAAQVTIDNLATAESVGQSIANGVHRYDMPPGKPKLQVVKVASQKQAQPGDVIDFTIRFDNIGNETIGNVTLIDNLTTRLEYVENSAQCDLPANFITQANDGESLILRWEITDALPVGKGGIIRFQCKVR